MGPEAMCLCVLPCRTQQRAELHLRLTQNGSRQSHLPYFSFLHPLPKAHTVRLNEHSHRPDRTGATTSKHKLNPADAGISVPYAVTGFVNLAYVAVETTFGASIPQAPEMVLETMKKRQMWWLLPDKLLLGLEAAEVDNVFIYYEISLLPSPQAREVLTI